MTDLPYYINEKQTGGNVASHYDRACHSSHTSPAPHLRHNALSIVDREFVEQALERLLLLLLLGVVRDLLASPTVVRPGTREGRGGGGVGVLGGGE